MDNKFNDVNERISKLYNDGTSSREIRTNVMAPEEQQKVRKTMLLLFFLTMITAFAAIIVFLNPFETLKKNNNVNKPISNKDELPLGEISTSNEIVKELNRLVELSVIDLYYVDTFSFFEKESVTSNELSDELKMHLIEKNYLFVNLLTDKGLLEYIETCNEEGLAIPKEDFDEVVTKVLGPNASITSDLSKTMHYTQSADITNLLISKKEDKYVVTCDGEMKDADLTKYPSQMLIKAIKTNEGIELYYNVIFIDDSNVYKDYLMTELITADKNSNYEVYIERGSTYKYTFNIDSEKNYYLSKIELVK